MKTVWSHEALRHLTAIYEYVAADSPTYAQLLIDRITRRTQQLTSFPYSGGRVLEYDDPSVRELLEGSYRIIHRVGSDRVEILAVIHAAQLLPPELR